MAEEPLGARPILVSQRLNAPELALIRGDESEFASECLSGDEHIIGANRTAGCFELHADDSRGLCICTVEGKQINRAGKEKLESSGVGFPPSALGHSVPKFEQDDA